MRRLSFLVSFLLFVVIICGVYRVANQYQGIERQVNRFDAEAEDEHENIRVLQAEWAFLTSPVRLEKIARENFQLQPVDGRQIVAIATIPVRATLDAQEAETNLAANPQPAAAQPALPPGVTTAPAETATVANALPPAATQALPSIEATPVNAEVAR